MGAAAGVNEKDTVRADNITEFIPERTGPVILKTFFPESIAFRLIPANCLQQEHNLRMTGNDN